MKNLFLCFALVGMASTLCAQERGAHARFRIAFVELVQYENHRFLHFGNNERLPKLRIHTPVPLFRDQQALRRFGNRLLARKDPNGRTGSDDEQLFDKKGLFYFQPMASYYIPLGKKFYYVPRFYIGFGFGKNQIGTHQ